MYGVNSAAMLAGIILGGIIGLLINLIPTIIAFIKGNTNKMQIILLNIVIPWTLSIIVVLINIIFSVGAILSIIISIINIILWIVALVKAIKGY